MVILGSVNNTGEETEAIVNSTKDKYIQNPWGKGSANPTTPFSGESLFWDFLIHEFPLGYMCEILLRNVQPCFWQPHLWKTSGIT